MTPRLRLTLAIAVAPLSVAAATVVKQLIPALDVSHTFVLYFFAVAGSAWIGGLAAGAVATVLVAIIVPAIAGLSGDVLARTFFFSIESLLVAFLIDSFRHERKRIAQANFMIERSRELLENIIETVPSAIVATEPDGSIFLFNDAAERLTGYNRSEVIGKSLLDVFVPPAWKDAVRKRFADPESPEVREPHRNPWRMKSGEERLIEWRCAAMPAPSGSRILGVGVDVTEIRRIEDERAELIAAERAARAAAEEASVAKDRFVGMISHELRAPLTSILGWAQLLRATDDQELLPQGLAAIEENARAQARLVDELLDYTRIVSGKIEIARKPVHVEKIVRSVVDAFVPEAQRKRLEIHSSIDADGVVVEGDESRLRQVFMNILQNAVRYTDQGSINVRAAREDGRVKVSIEDTGRGIAREFLPRIFDRFSQANPATDASKRGLGLGLAIVKELVTLHGGEVVAESDGPGKGARVSVVLPVAS